MLTKKDWETAREQHANLLVNSTINNKAHQFMLDVCDEELKKFPEEDKEDPIPDDMKEVVEAVK